MSYGNATCEHSSSLWWGWCFSLKIFSFTPLSEHFRDIQHKKNNLALLKKNLFTNSSWNIFDIIKFLFRFLGPTGTPQQTKWKNSKFHMCCVGYQNGVKWVCGVNFWKNFWKIIHNKDFGVKIFEKGEFLIWTQA